MTNRSRTMLKQSAILLAVLPLAACISFGAEPPPSLLTLTTEATVATGQPQSSADAATILITVPAVPQQLPVLRVPVQARSEEGRVGKECVRKGRYRWVPYH